MTDENLKIQQLTIKLYALHRAYMPLSFSDNINKVLQSKMQKYAEKIEELGATIQTTTDGITKLPKVRNLDGNFLSYDIGKLECENINSLIRENFNKFTKSY